MNRLKDLREDHDLTQVQMAKLLNVTQVAYSYYENEKRSTPIELLIKLASFYDTSVDYILGVTDQKNAYAKKKKITSSFEIY